MTEPRFALPGDTVMVTRRTLRRHHLFRPDPAIRQLYLYVLAVCAKQFGILVHAVTLMSTHEHLVVTDPTRRLPDTPFRPSRLCGGSTLLGLQRLHAGSDMVASTHAPRRVVSLR